MADTINIDILSYTRYPLIIPVINEAHPAYDIPVTENQLLTLIQLPNYTIYEAGTTKTITGSNIEEYFPHGGGGGGGTDEYPKLTKKPSINGTTILGDKSAIDYNLLSIPPASSTTRVKVGQPLVVSSVKNNKIESIGTIEDPLESTKDKVITLTDWVVDKTPEKYPSADAVVNLINDLDMAQVDLSTNESIASIKEENGKLTVTKQNIDIESNAVSKMTSYKKPTSLDVKNILETDSLNTAIGKLEYAIDNKKIDNPNIKQGNGILFSNKIEDDIEYTVINNNGVISISNSTEKANVLIITVIDPDDVTKTKDIELPYNLQIASKTQKGIIKIGDGFNIVDGKLDISLGDGLFINDNGFVAIKPGNGLKVNEVTGDIEVNVGEGLSIDENGKIKYTGTKTTYTGGSGISIDIDETDENNSIITNTGILDIKASDNVNTLIKTIFDKETNSSKDVDIEIKTDVDIATKEKAGIIIPDKGLSIDNEDGNVSVNIDNTKGLSIDESTNTIKIHIGEGLEFDDDGAIKTTGTKSSYSSGTGIGFIQNPDEENDTIINNLGILDIVKSEDDPNMIIVSKLDESDTTKVITEEIKISSDIATVDTVGVVKPGEGLSIDENGTLSFNIGEGLEIDDDGSVKSTGIKNTYTGKNGISIIENPDDEHDRFIINTGVLSVKESEETNEFIFSYYNEETSEIIDQPVKIITSEIALATNEKPGIIQPSFGLTIDENGLVQVKIGKGLKFNEETNALDIVTVDELNEETWDSENVPTTKAVTAVFDTKVDKTEFQRFPNDAIMKIHIRNIFGLDVQYDFSILDPDDDDGMANPEDIADIFENPPSLEELLNNEIKHPDYAEHSDIADIFTQDPSIPDGYRGGDPIGGFRSLTVEEIDSIFNI